MQSQQQYHTFTLTTEPENASPSQIVTNNQPPSYFQNPIAGQLPEQAENTSEKVQQIEFFRDTPQTQKVTFHSKQMINEDNQQQTNVPRGKTSNEEEQTAKTLEVPYSQAEATYSLQLQRQCQSEGGNEIGQDFIYEDKEDSVVLGNEAPGLVLAESASSQLTDQRQAFSMPWGAQSQELKISPEQLQQQFQSFQQQQPNSQKSISTSTQMQMISQSPQQSPQHLQVMASQTSQRRVSLASQQNSQRQISQLSQQKSLPISISPQLSPEASLGSSQKYDNYTQKGNGSIRGIEFEQQQKQIQADNLLRRQYLPAGQYQQQQYGWGEEQKNNFTSEEVGEALEELKTGQVQSGLDKFEAYLHKGFRTLNAETFGKVFMRIVKRLNNLSVDFLQQGDIQSALLLLTKCDQWTQTPGFGYYPVLRALILNHFGCAFRRQEQYKKAVNCCEQALQILQNSNERNYRGLTYLNLSALSSQQGEHKKGLDLARIALLESQHEFMEELKTRKNKQSCENDFDDDADLDYQNKIHTLVISYHNIAAEEEYFGNYEEALLHYEYSLGAAEEYLGQNSRISEHFREQFTKFTQRYAHYKIEGRPIGISDAQILHSDQFQVTGNAKKKGQAGNKRRNLKKKGERSLSAKVISPYMEPKQQRIQQKQQISQQQQKPQSDELPNTSDPQYDFTGFPNKQVEETQGRIVSAGTKRSNSAYKRPLSSQRPLSAVFSGEAINQFKIEADQQRKKFETQRIGSPKKIFGTQDQPELYQFQQNKRQSQHASATPAEGQQMQLVRIIKRKSSKKKNKSTKNLSLRGYPLESADQQDQNNQLASQSMFNNKSIDFASLFPAKSLFSSTSQAKYQQIQTSQSGAYFSQYQGVSAFKGGQNQILDGQISNNNNNNNGKSYDRNSNGNMLYFNSQFGEKQTNNLSKNLTFQYQQQPSLSGYSSLRPSTPSIGAQTPQEIVYFNKESNRNKLEKQLQQQQPSSNQKNGISRIQLLESLQKQYQQASNNLQSLESKIQEEIAKNASKSNKERFDTEQNYEIDPSSNSPSKRTSIKPTHKKSSSYSSIKNMFSAGSSNKPGRQNSLSSLAVVEGEKKLIYLPNNQFQIRSAKVSMSSSSNTSLTTATKNNNNRRSFTSNGTLLASSLQPSQAAPLSATNLYSLQKQPEQIAVSNFSAPSSSFNLSSKIPLSDSRKYPEKQMLSVGINPNTPSTQSSWQTTPLSSGQFQNLANNSIQQQQQYQQQPPQNAWRVYQSQGWLQFPMNQNFLGTPQDNRNTINTQETLVNILRTQLSCLNPQQDKLLFEGNLQFVLNRTKLQLQITFTSEQFVGQLEHCINVSDLFISHQTDDFAMVGLLVAFSGEILKSLFVNISQNCLSIFFTDSKNSSNNIGDGQILLDKVLLKLDVKHLSMKQDVEIIIKNSNESILLLCEESAPLQDSHTNDDGTNEGEDNIKPLVNTDILNIHLNREQSNKTEQSSTDSINPLVIDAGGTQQDRNFRRNNLTSVRGKRSVGEEMILEVIEETDTFSQLKNNHMNVTNTQSLSNIGNTMPNNRSSSFMNNNNQNSLKNSEVVNSKTEGESTGKGSRNQGKKDTNNYQADIFEEIQDLGDGGEEDDFEQNCKLALAEGELKQNNSRPKSSYERRVQPSKKKQETEKEQDQPSGQDKLLKDGQTQVKQEDSSQKGNKQDKIIQEIEDNSTSTSKYGFQTRDFLKRKPQPSSNSKLLLEIESAFELPHDDVRFDNDKKQLSNFGGFEEEPGFSNSKREHTFDDSQNQSLQEIVAETMEGQQSKQGINNLRSRTSSSPGVVVEGQQRQMNKKVIETTPSHRVDYQKSEYLPFKEEDQNVRRATPPPKIVINNGFDNEDPYLAYDNKQQEEANKLRQQEDEKANEEFQKLLEESDPERLNFTAALIQRRFRNKKLAKEQEEQKLNEDTSTKDNNFKRINLNVKVKEDNKEKTEVVVLDGPIGEYERVASLIGNAYRNRKRKEKELKGEQGAGVDSTKSQTLQGNDKNVDLKDQTQKDDKNSKGNEPATASKKEEEKVVLEGPIEEYEQVANKIGAAFRLKKKRQAEAAEALKKQKEFQTKQPNQEQLLQNNSLGNVEKNQSNTTPFSSSLIADQKQEMANSNDLSHGSEAVKVLTEEQEKLMTGDSVLNDTDAQGNTIQDQAHIPIVKKKSQVQGKFKLNRRFKQQVDFII